MATATLTFDLSDPGDEASFERANRALDAILVLWDFDQYLRSEYKYNGNEPAYKFREELIRMMNNRGIDLDKLLQ